MLFEKFIGGLRMGALLAVVGTQVETADAGGYIENQSYSTLCAEVDNINIPFYAPGTTAFRIVATHPTYFPTSIDERGADWTDCEFTDPTIWLLGNQDGQNTGFATNSFSDPDYYYAPDDPPAGIDQPYSEFPNEINHDWMNNQFIIFTADEPGDANIVLPIGAILTVAFADMNGILEIEMLTGDGTNWVSHGTRVFDSGNMTQSWTTPDFTWIEGVDANYIHLRVLKSDEGESTEGAWGTYDYLELRKRPEQGETVERIHDGDDVKVDAVHIDFWWRAPRAMDVNVVGDGNHTNAHYFRIIRRIPDTQEFPEIFVLYQDCNARIIPFPPEGVDWVPYGSSVQIGATPESIRPFADIESVVIDPETLRIDITYEDASTATVRLDVNRERHIVDVSDVTYDTGTLPFARFRSMWVRDGNADIDRIRTRLGKHFIMDGWHELEGPWWFFTREVPSYHNTYCPDFFIEIVEPSPAFLTRSAASRDEGNNDVVVGNSHASTGQVLQLNTGGGDATFELDLLRPWLDVQLRVRYSDIHGGTPMAVYLDGNATPVAEWKTTSVEGTNAFTFSPKIPLGDTVAGPSSVRVEADAGSSGVALDVLEWISQPTPLFDDVLITDVEHEAGPRLLNASFEDGDGTTNINHWAQWDGLTREDWANRTGDWGVMMQGWTTGGGIFQDLPGVEGNEYTFSIWGNPTDDWEFDHFDVSIFLQFRDTNDVLIQQARLTEGDLTGPIDQWTQYSVKDTAPTGTTIVRAGMEFGDVTNAGAGAFRFDDAQLNADDVDVVFPEAYTNVYLSVRYAEENAPHRVELLMDDVQRAWFPTENTGGEETFVWGPPLYLGDVPAGTSTFAFIASDLNMDRFRLVSRQRVNRPPVLEVPSPHTLVMGDTTNVALLAYDLDNDPVALSALVPPTGAVLDEDTFTWQAVPGYGGSTIEVAFVASDPHGATNSSVTNTALFNVPFDSDGDGLPDEWEWVHFETLEYGPDDDVDGDGMTNYEHWIAGTHPNDDQSLFRIHEADPSDMEGHTAITVGPTISGRRYTIDFLDGDLSEQPQSWTPFANTNNTVGTWFETNATASTFTFIDDSSGDTTGGAPADGVRTYRIRVEWP